MYILIVSVTWIYVLEPLIYIDIKLIAFIWLIGEYWSLKKECHRLMESSQQQYCWSFSIKWRRSFFVVAFNSNNSNSTPNRCCVLDHLLMNNCRNVLWKSNIVEMSYHVEKSISLNGLVATFNSTNIYKIIENRCSSKKMLLWTILQFEIFHS